MKNNTHYFLITEVELVVVVQYGLNRAVNMPRREACDWQTHLPWGQRMNSAVNSHLEEM